jgi:hypothetical protein
MTKQEQEDSIRPARPTWWGRRAVAQRVPPARNALRVRSECAARPPGPGTPGRRAPGTGSAAGAPGRRAGPRCSGGRASRRGRGRRRARSCAAMAPCPQLRPLRMAGRAWSNPPGPGRVMRSTVAWAVPWNAQRACAASSHATPAADSSAIRRLLRARKASCCCPFSTLSTDRMRADGIDSRSSCVEWTASSAEASKRVRNNQIFHNNMST